MASRAPGQLTPEARFFLELRRPPPVRGPARRIFRDFIRAIGTIELTETDIVVSFQKRARNPLLIAAGFAQSHTPVPWLAGRRLRFRFG